MAICSKTQLMQVTRLSLPMAGSRFLQMLSGFISTMMVSHLGKTVLASCALIGATLTPILMMFISIVFSLSFIVGQFYGGKKYRDIGALVQEGFLLSLLLGLCMMGCCWYADRVLHYFGENPVLLVFVRQYFHMLMWGVIPILLQSCLEQFFYGVLKQRIVITVNFCSVLLGVPLAYSFIFGKFGCPALGVGGLALTFVMQAWFGFLVLLGCAYYHPYFAQFEIFKKRIYTRLIYLKQIFRIGWPMSVQFGGELGAFFVMTMMVGWLGTDALAASQITQQWLYLVVVPIFAMSEASGILVGQSVGAKDFSQLKMIARASLILSIGLVLILNVGFIFFPHFLASFYMNAASHHNAQVIALIRPLFLLMALTLLFNSIRDVITGSLRGLFDTQFPMQVGLLVMWCLVLPLGYFFAFSLHLNVVGFRIGGNIGLLIGALIIYWRWTVKLKEYV